MTNTLTATDAQKFLDSRQFSRPDDYFDENHVDAAYKALREAIIHRPINTSTDGVRDRWSFPDGSALVTYTPYYQDHVENWTPGSHESFWISEAVHNDWLEDPDYTKDLDLDVKWKLPFVPIFRGMKPKAKDMHLVYGKNQYRLDVENTKAEGDNYADPDQTTTTPATQLAEIVFAEREAELMAAA